MEVLDPTIGLSENGTRASFQIQSFSNYAVAHRVGHRPSAAPASAAPTSAASATTKTEPVQMLGPTTFCGLRRQAGAGEELDAAEAASDAYFTAFAPPHLSKWYSLPT